MIFTDNGQVFKIKVHEIPEADPSARGKAVVNLVQLSSERKLVAVMPVKDFTEEIYLTMVTKNGVIKKTALSDYQNIRVTGINAINIDEGDELLEVIRTDGKCQIFIATHDGMAVRFKETDVRPMGRAARGVRGVNLRKGDYVVSVCTGAFILARSGLLDGKSASTHHWFWDRFANNFPQVKLEKGVRFVDNGKVLTAGGLTSGIDVALHIVERYYGREVAQATAEYMEYQSDGWKRGGLKGTAAAGK
jgi:DNA gyrase/topoisomerase IV subunit A